MRRTFRTLLAAAGLIFALGCGDDTAGPSFVGLNGTWSGDAGGADMTLTLVETGGDVNGSGTISAGAGSLDLTVDGTRSGADVSLTVTSQGFEPLSMAGTVSGTTFTGTMDGSGFDDAPFNLTRQ